MKILNAIAAALLALGVVYMMNRAPTPPEDRWFQAVVIDSEWPVLVKFGATWCPPCHYLDGVISQAGSELSHKVKVVRIDVDEKPELARHYGISAIPRVFLFRQGELKARHGGFADASELQGWVDRYTK